MITAYMLARALVTQQLEEAAHEGIDAFVTLYYLNYTDATELDPHFLSALHTLAYHTGWEITEDEVNETIRKAEAEFEDDPQNPPRRVHTAACEDPDDEDVSAL